MTPAVEPQLRPDEFARVGQDIFERRVKPLLTPEDDGKYVAINVVTEEYEIDGDEWDAIARLRGRGPVPRICLLRVGKPYRMSYRMRFGK